MAQPTARSRLVNRLSRNRSSSPREDDFATAASFDLTDSVLADPVMRLNNLDPHQLPGQSHGRSTRYAAYVDDEEGSTGMSIEVGRGVRQELEANVGDTTNSALRYEAGDSLYDIKSTPPMPVRFQTKVIAKDDELPVKGQGLDPKGPVKQRSLSEALGRSQPAKGITTESAVVPRNTRFTKARMSSVLQQALTNAHAVAQPTVTTHSFMLPNLPNITELVSGQANGKRVQTRFTSNTSRILQPGHLPISSIPIPSEEKAIYTGLQLLKERVTAPDMEKVETVIPVEQREVGGSNSHIGNEELRSSAHDQIRPLESTGITAISLLETRLSQLQRDLETALVQKTHLQRRCEELSRQLGSTQEQLEAVHLENQELTRQGQRSLTRMSRHHDAGENEQDRLHTQRSMMTVDDPTSRTFDQECATHEIELARRIAKEIVMYRRRLPVSTKENRGHASRESSPHPEKRCRSTEAAATITDPTQASVAGMPNLATLTRQPRRDSEHIVPEASQDFRKVTVPRSKMADPEGRDLTEISVLDAEDIAALRKKIEQEYMASREQRAAASAATAIPRKSSLRDLTAGLETGQETLTKNVRVQSPHTSDISIIPPQNEVTAHSIATSKSGHRRRNLSNGSMTSAFILPDITMQVQPGHANKGSSTQVAHEPSRCSVCRPDRDDLFDLKPLSIQERTANEEADLTAATVRPSQTPSSALALVLKQLHDEVTHLKLELASLQKAYYQHNPALSRRKRVATKERIDKLYVEIEKRSDQIYALQDVVEGHAQDEQKHHARAAATPVQPSETRTETTNPMKIDNVQHAKFAKQFGASINSSRRNSVAVSEATGELPWEGLSDYQSEEE